MMICNKFVPLLNDIVSIKLKLMPFNIPFLFFFQDINHFIAMKSLESFPNVFYIWDSPRTQQLNDDDEMSGLLQFSTKRSFFCHISPIYSYYSFSFHCPRHVSRSLYLYFSVIPYKYSLFSLTHWHCFALVDTPNSSNNNKINDIELIHKFSARKIQPKKLITMVNAIVYLPLSFMTPLAFLWLRRLERFIRKIFIILNYIRITYCRLLFSYINTHTHTYIHSQSKENI